MALSGEPPAAVPAARFVDSIGVNVHARGAYEKNHEVLNQKLGELGVHHIRDGAHSTAYRLSMGFFEAHAIKTTWITGRRVGGQTEWKSPLKPTEIATELREIREQALACTEAIEGPNEYDLHSDERDRDWPATLRDYQEKLYTQAKADPVLRAFPIVGPSLTSQKAYEKVGDLDASMDAACVHHYQSNRHPGSPGWGGNGYGSIDWMLKYLVARQSPMGKPIWSTECGYSPGSGETLSEEADAKYTLRMLAEFFHRGYFRSYKYELLGQQWGLLRGDLSERPSFQALQRLIGILQEPSAPPAGPAAAMGQLDYALADAPRDLRQLLLQKRDGAFCLLLWREVPSWDVEKKRDLEPAPKLVRLRLPQGASAVVFQPNQSADARALAAEPEGIPLPVADSLLVVRISPRP